MRPHSIFLKISNRLTAAFIGCVLFAGGGALVAKAQTTFELDYQPIRYTGTIPPEILQSVTEKAKKQAAQTQSDQLNAEEKLTFYSVTNSLLNQMLHNGKMYANDELTAYVNRVVDHILRAEPEKRKKLKVYVGRFGTMNAYALGEGTIFVHVGLLARLENEAQLAFILCHEIAHIEFRHGLESFTRQTQMNKTLRNKSSELERMSKAHSYTREHEREADREGLKLYLTTDYEPAQAPRALQILELENEDLHLPEIKAGDWLNSSAFTIDNLEQFTRKTQPPIRPETSTEELEGILTKLGEAWSTHPAIPERIKTIEPNVKNLPAESLFVQTEEAFNRMRTTARFELVELAYDQGNYARCFYFVKTLQQSYPQNAYLTGKAAASLYWLAYYADIKCLRNVMPYPEYIEKEPNFKRLVEALDKLYKDQVLEMGRGLMADWVKLYPNNEDLFLYQAMATEIEDEAAARKLYKTFLTTFPGSTKTAFVKSRLE